MLAMYQLQSAQTLLAQLDYPTEQLVLFANMRPGEQFRTPRDVGKLSVYPAPLHVYAAWSMVLEKHRSAWYIFAAGVYSFSAGALLAIQQHMTAPKEPRDVFVQLDNRNTRACSFQAYAAYHEMLERIGRFEDVVSSAQQLEVRRWQCFAHRHTYALLLVSRRILMHDCDLCGPQAYPHMHLHDAEAGEAPDGCSGPV